MKNIFAVIGIGIFITIASIFFFGSSGNVKSTGNLIDSGGETQIVKLSVENGRYIIDPPEVKKGIIVRMEADMSEVPGCSRSIVIPSFNVRKNFNDKNNIVEFLPDKAGTFNIACSMNMYTGTFIVLDDDGNKANYIEKPVSGGSTCGASGGCGCGG